MQKNHLLPVRIVLVETHFPGNIGAAARAMKTMDCDQLYLVNPQAFPHAEATMMATEAADILERAVIVDSLDAAIADCGVTFATSTRPRSYDRPTVNAREAAQIATKFASANTPAALVFGPEPSGLSNAHLAQCQYRAYIPASDACSSLNLAQAVQIFAYLLREAWPQGTSASDSDVIHATHAEREQLFKVLSELLAKLDLDKGDPEFVPNTMRNMLNRANLSRSDVSVLRGVIARLEARVQGRQDP